MLYLIQTNLWLLLLAALFAGVAGWTWAALRSSPKEQALFKERDRVVRETLDAANVGAPSAVVPVELQREMETLRRRGEMDAAKTAEVQRALEGARASADEAASRAAEAERALEQHKADAAAQPQALVSAAPAPSEEEQESQAWRLRYFERRVRYLESQPQAASPAPAPEPAATGSDPQEMLQLDWRARYAEARARHLEEALRSAQTPAPVTPEDDELSRWRMTYLEKRLAHAQAPAEEPAPPQDDLAAEADRLKWRTRYLESRVRHLDALVAAKPEPSAAPPVAQPTPPPAPEPEAHADAVEEEPTPVPLVPAGAEERPPSLPAPRNGAPDDLSLIDGVSPMQRSTLNSLGIYHFEQIAKWTPANVAWVDQYLRLRGRISEEEWVEQADDLAREGPAARRVLEDELA